MRDALTSRIHAVEEAYEYMLAYAAQGLQPDAQSSSGSELRTLMTRAAEALAELPSAIDAVGQPGGEFAAFRALVARDAERAGTVLRLVLAQPAISSALVDNLNASTHLRTLLTDLFLLDEVLKTTG